MHAMMKLLGLELLLTAQHASLLIQHIASHAIVAMNQMEDLVANQKHQFLHAKSTTAKSVSPEMRPLVILVTLTSPK